METVAEASAYDAMDHGEVNRRFVADFLAARAPAEVWDEVVDLGTGTARIPIELCRCDGEVRVRALDSSLAMLDVARLNVEIAGLADRILLGRADAKQLPLSDGSVSAVISNSLLHHLADPAAAVAEAVRITSPGGRLFFRDLVRPADGAALLLLVQTYAGHEAPAAQQMFADSLHAALRLDEIQALVARFGFSPDTVRMTSDRHWTWSALRETN